MSCPPPVQRLGGIALALEQVGESALILSARKLGVLPVRRRLKEDLRRHLFRKAYRNPSFALRLARELSAICCQVRGRPEPDDVISLIRQSPRKGLTLGLLWGMGEGIDDPDWTVQWEEWLKESAVWRNRLAKYPRYCEDVEAMELAESLVAEAEQQKDVLLAALKQMAQACRHCIRDLKERIEALELANAQLVAVGHIRPLAGRTILVLGDPSHAVGYRDILSRYGAECIFADGRSPQEARRALGGRADAVVVVTAYATHAVTGLIDKYAPETPVFFANRGGLGEMERVVGCEIASRLGPVFRAAPENVSA